MVQWLGLRAPSKGGTGSIPTQGTKISEAMQHGWKKNEKKKERKEGRRKKGKKKESREM